MRTIKKMTIILWCVLVNAGVLQAKERYIPITSDTINPVEAVMLMESYIHNVTETGGALRWYWNFTRKTFENSVMVDSGRGSGTFWATGEKFQWIHEGFIFLDSVEEQTQDDQYNVIVNYKDSTVTIGPLMPLYKRIFNFDIFDTLMHQHMIDSITVASPMTYPHWMKISINFKPESPFSLYEVEYDTTTALPWRVKYRIRNDLYIPGSADFAPPDENYTEYAFSFGGQTVFGPDPVRFNLSRFFTRRDGQFILAPRFASFELINLYDQ